MKFKVGDKVRIKSLDWYNKNKDRNGYVYGKYPLIPFAPERAKYCGQEYEVVYADKIDNTYQLDCGEEDIRTYWWTDEMLEKIETLEDQPLFTLTAEENKLLQSLLWKDYHNSKNMADNVHRQYGSYASKSYEERASLCKGLIKKLENYQYEQDEEI